MDRFNSKKSQGRIKINIEASEKLNALFSQPSDTSLVYSPAEQAANEKRETTDDRGDRTTSTSAAEANCADTCVGVNSLPRIVITPPANNNQTAKKDVRASSDAKKLSLPAIKPPLLQTSQLHSPGRIRSAMRRTPSFGITSRPSPIGKEKPKNVSFKLPTIDPSGSLTTEKEPTDEQANSPSPVVSDYEPERNPPLIPIAEDKPQTPFDEDVSGNEVPCSSPGPAINEDSYSDDFEDDDDDDNDSHNKDDDHDQDDRDQDDSNDDSDSDDDYDDKRQTSRYTNNGPQRPISGVNRRVTGGTFDGKIYPPCVMPQYQRSTFPLFGAAVIAPSLTKTNSMPSLTETSSIEKQLPAAVSAGLRPNVISQRRKKNEESNSQLIRKMTSLYALTPLKMIANELIMLHYDVYPTEICPGMNRSPSFTGVKDEDNGLMSGQCSPKLDIPRRRYCGRMIQQHPLVKYCYRMNDRRLAHLVKKPASSSSSSSSFDDQESDNEGQQKEPVFIKPYKPFEFSIQVKEEDEAKEEEKDKPISKENSYLDMFAKKLTRNQVTKKPLPFTKPSGYLEIYKKKVSFSKNKVLPPIGSKPSEDKQPALVLMPTPPSRPPPVSGQSAAMRSVRKARMDNQQQNNKISGIGKKQ